MSFCAVVEGAYRGQKGIKSLGSGVVVHELPDKFC